eukprot:6191101-Amphidinium_carterae.1
MYCATSKKYPDDFGMDVILIRLVDGMAIGVALKQLQQDEHLWVEQNLSVYVRLHNQTNFMENPASPSCDWSSA